MDRRPLRSGGRGEPSPMGHQTEQRAAEVSPAVPDILRVWRADRCVQASSAGVYLQWIKRFRTYCARHGLDERAELTLSGAQRFIASHARRRGLDARRLGGARTAIYALIRVYQVMGLNLPAWQPPQPVPPPATTLLRAYADYLVRHRGNPVRTVHKKLAHIGKLSDYLAGHGKTCGMMALTDIDAFLIGCAGRYARSTVADIAGSVRCFARFLLATAPREVSCPRHARHRPAEIVHPVPASHPPTTPRVDDTGSHSSGNARKKSGISIRHLLTLSVERKSGGDLAAPAMVCHPKAAISAVADWRPALALAATGAS